MEKIKNTLNKNSKFKCVIITRNKEEYEKLKDALVDLGYQHSIPLRELSDMMDERVMETGYEHCWRVSDYMGVCWSGQDVLAEEIEYWKHITADILEIKNGKLEFVE